MPIILGGTGHVGSAVARTLLQQDQPVTIITSDPKKSNAWQRRGATVAIANVHDTDTLRAVFQRGTRLFLLNPPADPATDTVAQERKSLTSILTALDGSGIQKVVAESTYGARPGDGIGDLGVLYEMEQGLTEKKLSVSIIRGAYYMSNWEGALTTARQEGVVHTLYPVDLSLPMVSPDDIGQLAARLLMEPVDKTGLYFMERPKPYSSAEVALAFAHELNQPVVAQQIPPHQWISVLTGMGSSQKGAVSMAAMTEITLKKAYEEPASPVRGNTTLETYTRQLVHQQPYTRWLPIPDEGFIKQNPVTG